MPETPLAISPIPPAGAECYRRAIVETDGGVVARGSISEAELKEGIAAGGHITAAVVVEEEIPVLNKTRFFWYLRVSWRRGYLSLSRWKNEGPRVYSDLDKFWDRLPLEFGYRGHVRVYRQDDPAVAELGLTPVTD